MGLTIGIDVGGTKIAAGVVGPDGTIGARTHRDTPADSVDKTAAAICDAAAELIADHEVEAVGIGAAGFVSSDRSTVLFAPNLAWRDEPLGARVAEELKVAGGGRERRERGRLGRVRLRCGARTSSTWSA